MGRNPRVHYSGAIYHVMSRGVDGRDIFIEDSDRVEFLDRLRRIVEDASANVLAYCLMGNHFHLAIRVGSTSLASIMQRVLTSYAQVINRRHHRRGHLFEARYKAIICLTDAYLAALIRYIHMNPVRAGIVSRPQDWPWSSAFGDNSPADFQEDLLDFDPWRKGQTQDFDMLRQEEIERRSLDDLGATISSQTGIDLEDMRSGDCRRTVVAAKRQFAQEAIRCGYQLTDVAKWMNSALCSVSRYARAKK